VILYRLLTNRLPIPAPSINSYLMSLGGTIPPPAIQWNPSLPLGLSQLIEWMLQKEPERRPRNIDSVIQELKRFEMLTPSSVTPAKTAVEKPRGTLPPSNPAPPPDLEPKRDTPPSNATPPTPAKPSPAISTTCPKCRTIFNLSRDLFGKPMRCPNSDCREIFLVSETPPRAEKVSKKKPANQSKPVVQEDEDEDFPIVTTRPKSKQKTPAQKIQPSPRRFDDDDDPQSYRRKTASSKMSMIIFGGIGALITIIATIVALLNLFR
jgi:serine/threonine protein kinase